MYRDLSLPVGSLNPARRAASKRRFEEGAGEGIPPFHHGSHYSSPGVVLFWLLRQEPFTSMHLELQGGRFDHPDRLFNSFAETWSGVWNNNQDTKEMVPELFYDASFLCNTNGFVFGETQGGVVVNDVVLPPWASSPEHFIALHRAALESDFVTQRLHLWIDLVFGCAQQGPRAVEATNVFYWTTYPDKIDWARVTDEMSRAALVSQIENFGQCPDVLFKQPHPARRIAAATVPRPVMSLTTGARQGLAPEKIAVLGDGRVILLFAGGRHLQCTLNDGVFQADRAKERPELPLRISVGDGKTRLAICELGGAPVLLAAGGMAVVFDWLLLLKRVHSLLF